MDEFKVHFSLRANGACPLCQQNTSCEIKEKISDTLAGLPYNEQTNPHFEIVIYTCPQFVESP